MSKKFFTPIVVDVVTGLELPILNSDAANKEYVDTVIASKINDAPNDNKFYSRRNLSWEETPGTNPLIEQFINNRFGLTSSGSISLQNVTTTETLDYINKEDGIAIKWIVTAKQGQNVYVIEIIAIHNGDNINNITDIKYSTYSKLKLGIIENINISVIHNTSQLELKIEALNPTNFSAIREIIAFI